MKPCYRYGNPPRECSDGRISSANCYYLRVGGDWETCRDGGAAVDRAETSGTLRGLRFRVAELEAENGRVRAAVSALTGYMGAYGAAIDKWLEKHRGIL